MFWGEQPPFTPLGYGGGHFFWSIPHDYSFHLVQLRFALENRTAGSNQQCGFLTLLVASDNIFAGIVTAGIIFAGIVVAGIVKADAALGVFLGL